MLPLSLALSLSLSLLRDGLVDDVVDDVMMLPSLPLLNGLGGGKGRLVRMRGVFFFFDSTTTRVYGRVLPYLLGSICLSSRYLGRRRSRPRLQ